jgi:hypothetical protein
MMSAYFENLESSRAVMPVDLHSLTFLQFGSARIVRFYDCLMDLLAFLRDETRSAWEWLESTVSDVTEEQANWWPPGTANSIGATYLHVVINPDVEINRLLYGCAPIIERDWHGDVGQGVSYDPDHFDRWDRGVTVQWERLHEYGRAVHEWLVGLLDQLNEDDLERPVDMSRSGLGTWKGCDLLALHGITHVYIHGGEIACLKGLQGAKGYRSGFDAH